MTKEKIREVLDIYRKKLTNLHTLKSEFPHDQIAGHYNKIAIRSHIFTMIDKVEEFLEEDRLDKAFRWLGFIQGCMWTTSLYTIEELKNHNCQSK